MSAQPVFEGTWEEMLTHASMLAGQRVRLYVVSDEDEPYPGVAPQERPSTAESLLKYAGTWVGDDLEDCLKSAYDTRMQAEFK